MKTVYIWVALALLSSACGNESKETNTTEAHHEEVPDEVAFTAAQYKIAGIALGKVEMYTISGTIQANGLLDVPPQSKVSISAPMAGFVKETEMLQGSRVEKGQVVAVLQHPDYIQLQQDYMENYSQVEYLKAEYERQEELAKENVNAKKAVQQARASYLTKKATADGLRAKLQLLNINMVSLESGQLQNTIRLYAPISGYVTKVNTNIGAFVNPADVLFEIVNTGHLHAELTIFEKDVPRLKISQQVLFTLANETNHRIAKVHLIGREINADRSVQIHCHIEEQDRELIPGMYLKAIVETDSAHVTAVPDEAIVGFGGKKFIFIVDDTEHHEEEAPGQKHEEEIHFKMLEVGVGENELGFTHVVLPKDFSLETKIVSKGAFSILAKMKNSETEGGHAH